MVANGREGVDEGLSQDNGNENWKEKNSVMQERLTECSLL